MLKVYHIQIPLEYAFSGQLNTVLVFPKIESYIYPKIQLALACLKRVQYFPKCLFLYFWRSWFLMDDVSCLFSKGFLYILKFFQSQLKMKTLKAKKLQQTQKEAAMQRQREFAKQRALQKKASVNKSSNIKPPMIKD